MINYNENKNYETLPKVGEAPKVFEIKECKKVVDPNYKYNLKKMETFTTSEGETITGSKNLGYHYRYDLKDGKYLTINSWKPLAAFGRANVQDGDKIKVSHPEEGLWDVEIIKS